MLHPPRLGARVSFPFWSTCAHKAHSSSGGPPSGVKSVTSIDETSSPAPGKRAPNAACTLGCLRTRHAKLAALTQPCMTKPGIRCSRAIVAYGKAGSPSRTNRLCAACTRASSQARNASSSMMSERSRTKSCSISRSSPASITPVTMATPSRSITSCSRWSSEKGTSKSWSGHGLGLRRHSFCQSKKPAAHDAPRLRIAAPAEAARDAMYHAGAPRVTTSGTAARRP